MAVKQNQTFNQERKRKLPVTIQNTVGRNRQYNQSIKQIKLPTNQTFWSCPSLFSVNSGSEEILKEKKNQVINKSEEKSLLESPWGIRLSNGPHYILMVSTKRSVYASFYEKNSNNYHLSSAVQSLKEIKNCFKVTQHLFWPLGTLR